MQQLSRNLRQVEPLVRHGIQELQAGAPIDHTLREVALMASLVGAGASASQAIRAVERVEPQILGYGPYEQAEPGVHGGVYGQAGIGMPVGYGKAGVGMPAGYGKAGVGMPVGYAQPGVGMPVGYGKPVGYAMQPAAYGKGAMPYGVPMGGVLMGR